MNRQTPQEAPWFVLGPPVAGASTGLGRQGARRLVLHQGMMTLATARGLELLEQPRGEKPPGSVAIHS